jgi:hypothetical protein
MKVVELTGFVGDQYDASDMGVDVGSTAGASVGGGLQAQADDETLASEWDEVLAARYGARFWNVGCG